MWLSSESTSIQTRLPEALPLHTDSFSIESYLLTVKLIRNNQSFLSILLVILSTQNRDDSVKRTLYTPYQSLRYLQFITKEKRSERENKTYVSLCETDWLNEMKILCEFM